MRAGEMELGRRDWRWNPKWEGVVVRRRDWRQRRHG